MANITEPVFILDKSGSMCGLESDTIGGFNSMIKKQQSEDEGTAFVSTVLFNNRSQVLHDRISLDKVEPLTEKELKRYKIMRSIKIGLGAAAAIAVLIVSPFVINMIRENYEAHYIPPGYDAESIGYPDMD